MLVSCISTNILQSALFHAIPQAMVSSIVQPGFAPSLKDEASSRSIAPREAPPPKIEQSHVADYCGSDYRSATPDADPVPTSPSKRARMSKASYKPKIARTCGQRPACLVNVSLRADMDAGEVRDSPDIGFKAKDTIAQKQELSRVYTICLDPSRRCVHKSANCDMAVV